MPAAMRTRGLVYGLNYRYDPAAVLKGCINDTLLVGACMRRMGIPVEAYTDDTARAACSAKNIVSRLYRLAEESRRYNLDFVWIHYSGHGTRVADSSGDEKDGFDECIVPSDYRVAGMISDDTLSAVLRTFNPKTRVLCVFDCCHSGTLCDVKYSWPGDVPRIENPRCSVGAKVVTLSACMDEQVSADASQGSDMGALTTSLMAVLGGQERNAFSVLAAVRACMCTLGAGQRPKLCSTFDLAHDPALLPL